MSELNELETCVNLVMKAGLATGHATSHKELMSHVLLDIVEQQERIAELENQLMLEGTTNSQRCDRCHLANFFNGEEFKCWNCGLEHTGE